LFAGHYVREKEARNTFLNCIVNVWKDKGDVAKKYVISPSTDNRSRCDSPGGRFGGLLDCFGRSDRLPYDYTD
jgi:hypothetical protein